MDDMQPNVWSACLWELSGTTGRCGLPMGTEGRRVSFMDANNLLSWSAEEELVAVGMQN